MAKTSFLTNCPKCGYIVEAWTEEGHGKSTLKNVYCEGTLPHPDHKD